MRTEEFNHIILPMRSDLKAYALRLTESDDNAEDLVQEVMLRLWDMRQNIKAEDNLKALAITIMRNKFYDQCRHEERNFTTDRVMKVPIEDRRAEQRDEVNLIKQIVAQLPPLQQQIFRMKEIEGYTADEIMQITGCTADNLRKNLSRARLKIRETYMNIVKQNRTNKEGGKNMNDEIKKIDEFKGINEITNTNEFKTIQDLLDKYMDGATSNEEEATLRKYFEKHGNDIPEEWESYRALFSYIGFEQMNLSQILKEEEKEIDKKEAPRSRWLKYFGTSVAAAAIIAFLIVGIQKIAQPQPECYAVINGKVYTDQEFVHHEALNALEDVSADSEDPFSALDMMKQ